MEALKKSLDAISHAPSLDMTEASVQDLRKSAESFAVFSLRSHADAALTKALAVCQSIVVYCNEIEDPTG